MGFTVYNVVKYFVKGGNIMFETNIIKSLIKKIDEVKDSKEDYEYINDLFTIDNMINGKMQFDKNLIENIIDKYKKELDFLENLEKRLRAFQRTEFNNSSYSYKQWLLNIRHSLIRIGVMRILKRKGTKLFEDDLINNDNENLYKKLVEKLK